VPAGGATDTFDDASPAENVCNPVHVGVDVKLGAAAAPFEINAAPAAPGLAHAKPVHPGPFPIGIE